MRWAEEEFETLTRREWPDRQFDELGYLRIKGARRLDPEQLSILRELYLMRDARAREMDRPPFKVLGNRALLEIAERKPRKAADLIEIKGITDLLVRRHRTGGDRRRQGGLPRAPRPDPKTGRQRPPSDGPAGRAPPRRAQAVAIEAGYGARARPRRAVPELRARSDRLARPESADDLGSLPELKGWFVREFGEEVTSVSRRAESE